MAGRTGFVALLMAAGVVATAPPAGAQPGAEREGAAAAWMQVTLTDVNSGETFTVAEFAGTPVLLESFAVWCPVCTSQQRQLAELARRTGDRVVIISLDTDPNEDAALVQRHTAQHGFDWRYAVAPAELTRALIAEYGAVIASAPSAPMVLVCANLQTRLLRRGVKRAATLEEEVAAGC